MWRFLFPLLTMLVKGSAARHVLYNPCPNNTVQDNVLLTSAFRDLTVMTGVNFFLSRDNKRTMRIADGYNGICFGNYSVVSKTYVTRRLTHERESDVLLQEGLRNLPNLCKTLVFLHLLLGLGLDMNQDKHSLLAFPMTLQELPFALWPSYADIRGLINETR